MAKTSQPDVPRKLDEAVQPGGVYVKDGQVVDATGAPLDGWSVDSDGNAVKAASASSAETSSASKSAESTSK